MKKIFLVMCAALFSAGVAVAGDTEDAIDKYDNNGDGLLSRTEVAADQDLSARFQELDVNSDGQLGEDEIDSGPIDDFDEIGDDPLEDEESIDEAVDESEDEADDWDE